MNHTARVLLLAVVAIAFTVTNWVLHFDDSSLNYDEGDYYRSTSSGFVANWFDTDDVPLTEFVGMGIKAAKGEIPRSDLSKKIRSANSSAFLRHYHPPVAFYPAMVTRAVAPNLSEERQLRYGAFGLMIIWIGLLAFLSIRDPEFCSPWFVVVPASANWIASATGFNMHIMFGLGLVTFALCWYVYEKYRERSEVDRAKGYKRLGIFFLALAICSVEYSLFLIGFLTLWTLLTLWRKRDGWKEKGSELRSFLTMRLVDGLWLLGFMTLLWPAGVLKLGVLKSYVLQAYIALFRLEDLGSSFDSFWEMVTWKWTESPLELVLFVGGILAILWGWRQVLRRGSLFVTMLLVLFMNYLQFNPALNLRWYLFPAFVVVFTFFLHVLAERYGLSRAKEAWSALVLSLVVFGIAQATITIEPYLNPTKVRELIEKEPEAPLIVVQGIAPPLSAYFEEREVRGFHNADFYTPEIQDSMKVWAKDHIIVVLHDVQVDSRKIGEVDDVSVYAP